MSLPSLPSGVNETWLTELLRSEGLLTAERSVTSVTREQVGDGTGMMSELSRLRVTYDGEADLPNTFVIKYPSQNENNREIAMSYHIYEREDSGWRFGRTIPRRT